MVERHDVWVNGSLRVVGDFIQFVQPLACRRLVLLAVCLTLQESLGEFLNVLGLAESDVGFGLLDFDAETFGRCALVREVEFLGHLGDKHIASVASGVHNEEAIPRDAEHDYAVDGLLEEHTQVGVAWFKSLLISEPHTKTEVSV